MNFLKLHKTLGDAENGEDGKSKMEMDDLYTKVDTLGKGAYGTVYKALHRIKQRYYAIKHIDKKAAGQRGFREVMNEVETLRFLTHPYIVRLEDVYQDENNLWIVMEYVRNGELMAELKLRGRFPEAMVKRFTFHLLLALEYMHSKGVVHRDLKPANCLLNEFDGQLEVKIADFGFAVMTGGNLCLTSFCGTMSYMAPEIVMEKNYGKPVDMWALGVNIYLLLSGEYPFANSEDLAPVICAGHFSFSSPVWATEVSQGAKDLISRLLVVDDSRRLTATEALRHLWVRAAMDSDDSAPRIDEDDNADSPGVLQSHAKQRAEARRRRARIVFRGVVIVIMAAHRLVFWCRINALHRDGVDLPIVRNFSFLVSKRFCPAVPLLSARGVCNGNPKVLSTLVAMLEAGPLLETFDVGNNGIEALETIQAIAKACTSHPSLTALHLDGNPIPPLAGRTLQRLARSAPRLRIINVQNTSVGVDQVTQIAQALKEAEKKRGEVAAHTSSHHAVGVGGSGAPLGRGRAPVVSPPGGARPLLGVPPSSSSAASGGTRTPSSQRTRSMPRR